MHSRRNPSNRHSGNAAMKISRAKRDDAVILLDLLCSARVEIKLAARVCDEVHRDEYLSWMKKKCADGRILVATAASEIEGFLMFDGIQVIEYIVVGEIHRHKGAYCVVPG